MILKNICGLDLSWLTKIRTQMQTQTGKKKNQKVSFNKKMKIPNNNKIQVSTNQSVTNKGKQTMTKEAAGHKTGNQK